MSNILIGIILCFATGLLTIIVKHEWKGKLVILGSIVSQFFILPNAVDVLLNGKAVEILLEFSNPIGISILKADPLSAFFLILISFGSLIALIYSNEYMKHYPKREYSFSAFYIFFSLLASAMMLVVIIQNSLLFLIVWEVMSISSFFLVNFENDKKEVRKAAIYYLISMQIGAAFLIVAFSWLSVLSGSLRFDSFTNILSQNNYLTNIFFVLFFIGFGTKAGFIPFHTWLPRAHPAAPTGVSAIMSGVMIKTGIYGILRIIFLMGFSNYFIGYFVIVISIITGIFGVINAIAQHDLKRLLAYHSIENIGIIGLGIGVGLLGLAYNQPYMAVIGFLGGILHVFNHFTFKSLLFYGAGIGYIKSGTRNIEKLGGLARLLPITTAAFILGSLAISGMPLFSGFISEFAIYSGLFKGFNVENLGVNIIALIGIAGLAFIGVMAVLCFTKVVGICFLGNARSEYLSNHNEKSVYFILPLLVLSFSIILIGLFPDIIIPSFKQVLSNFIHVNFDQELLSIVNIFVMVRNVLLIFVGFILFFFAIRYVLLRNRSVTTFKTWDCGYQNGNIRMQYTGSSYALPFLNLVSGVIGRKTEVKNLIENFPDKFELETHSDDITEKTLIRPLIKIVDVIFSTFNWIQSGKLQQYILYGLIFLLLILFWIIGMK